MKWFTFGKTTRLYIKQCLMINNPLQEGKLREIKDVGVCVESLKKQGILLDAESFSSENTQDSVQNVDSLKQHNPK